MEREKLIYRLAILVSLIGLAISIYLTITHYYPDVPLACPETGIINCNNVLTSQYAYILGLPVAVLGVLFFIAELIVILVIKNNDYFIMLSGIGMAFVFYYIYSEYMVGSICIYCTGVHICAISLLILSLLMEKKKA